MKALKNSDGGGSLPSSVLNKYVGLRACVRPGSCHAGCWAHAHSPGRSHRPSRDGRPLLALWPSPTPPPPLPGARLPETRGQTAERPGWGIPPGGCPGPAGVGRLSLVEARGREALGELPEVSDKVTSPFLACSLSVDVTARLPGSRQPDAGWTGLCGLFLEGEW